MNYDGALAYLESLGTFGIQLGLARIERLLAKLNHPERNFRSVHVTGTNGKGSTSSFIASILRKRESEQVFTLRHISWIIRSGCGSTAGI